MAALTLPAFAVTWWAACYLLGRDPARVVPRRAAAALGSYALGSAVWTVAPGSAAAQVLLCLPALLWAGVAVALLPASLPERRQIDLGWRLVSVLFVLVAAVLPAAGRLVVLAPLAGGLVLLWRFRDQVRPPMLPAALAVAATLYAAALATLLLPAGVGGAGLLLAAIGLDLLVLGFLVAVAEAIDVGERLRPDLARSAAAGLAVTVLAGGPAAATLLAAPGERRIAVLQLVLVGVVVTGTALAAPIRRVIDAVAFRDDERLCEDRSALLLLAAALPRRRERHRLATTNEDDFRRFTRQALDHYHDLGRLMRSPLTDLPAVDRGLAGRAVDPGPVGQPAARAEELRAVLRECIDRLRPAGPFDVTDEWRHFTALHFPIVRRLDPYARRPRIDGLDRDSRRAFDWMRRYVPRRVLRRWQAEAAAMVAGRLWVELARTGPTRSTYPASPGRNG